MVWIGVEELRLVVVPLAEGLDRGKVAVVEADRGQDVGEPTFEAADHAIGLWADGSDQAVLDVVGGAELAEGMRSGGFTLAGR